MFVNLSLAIEADGGVQSSEGSQVNPGITVGLCVHLGETGGIHSVEGHIECSSQEVKWHTCRSRSVFHCKKGTHLHIRLHHNNICCRPELPTQGMEFKL